jgi:creatinine amidohydrolase/Fe(II)-dependent formamide hydrolase-like protein
MPSPDMSRVRWADLRVEEFLAQLHACPVVYLPMGLCEPHGHVAPFGLDTIKADYLCDEAARRFGGIVAPTMGTTFMRPATMSAGSKRSWTGPTQG